MVLTFRNSAIGPSTKCSRDEDQRMGDVEAGIDLIPKMTRG